MTVFADSSAVVKIYADEVGSGVVRELGAMYIAETTWVEVVAALWRKSSTGDVERATSARLVRRFERDLLRTPRFFVAIRVERRALHHAARLTGLHGLRACDAVQLAVALEVAEADPSCTTFASFDRALNAAAVREGFDLLA